MTEIHPKLQAYIATRDRRIARDQPWSPTPLADYMRDLQRNGAITVGGLTGSGGSPNPSWIEFRLWGEIVKKARALGMQIEETEMKHKNGSPTRNGGWWDSREYRLVRQ